MNPLLCLCAQNGELAQGQVGEVEQREGKYTALG